MVRILRKLDFQVDGDQVTVPSWRGDVQRMADLAEEVARFYGYNNIPTTLMRGQTTQGGYSPAQQLENQQLANAIENSDDPDMLESVARDKGYVKSGETLYIDVAN